MELKYIIFPEIFNLTDHKTSYYQSKKKKKKKKNAY